MKYKVTLIPFWQTLQWSRNKRSSTHRGRVKLDGKTESPRSTKPNLQQHHSRSQCCRWSGFWYIRSSTLSSKMAVGKFYRSASLSCLLILWESMKTSDTGQNATWEREQRMIRTKKKWLSRGNQKGNLGDRLTARERRPRRVANPRWSCVCERSAFESLTIIWDAQRRSRAFLRDLEQ